MAKCDLTLSQGVVEAGPEQGGEEDAESPQGNHQGMAQSAWWALGSLRRRSSGRSQHSLRKQLGNAQAQCQEVAKWR